jgi:hypothetical protein
MHGGVINFTHIYDPQACSQNDFGFSDSGPSAL